VVVKKQEVAHKSPPFFLYNEESQGQEPLIVLERRQVCFLLFLSDFWYDNYDYQPGSPVYIIL
jgi:hypothetical protein